MSYIFNLILLMLIFQFNANAEKESIKWIYKIRVIDFASKEEKTYRVSEDFDIPLAYEGLSARFSYHSPIMRESASIQIMPKDAANGFGLSLFVSPTEGRNYANTTIWCSCASVIKSLKSRSLKTIESCKKTPNNLVTCLGLEVGQGVEMN